MTSPSASQLELLLQLCEVLHGSLDLSVSLNEAAPLLQGLVGADHVALAVSRPGTLYDYAWYNCTLPDAFLEGYERIRDRDFVRLSVAQRPNQVLVDGEMLSRARLERHSTYRHAQDTGTQIEQVMAVMLAHEAEWSSGLALYRTRRREFSQEDSALLQRAVPHITRAVRNAREHGLLARGGWLAPVIDAVDVGVLWLDEDGAEVARTARASWLLEQHYPADERRSGGVPLELRSYWSRFVQARARGEVLPDLVRSAQLSSLHVRVVPLPAQGMYALALHVRGLPAELAARLSPRRAEVAASLLRGLSNAEIAARDDRALATIKQQVEEVCDALGVDGRKGLLQLVCGLTPHGPAGGPAAQDGAPGGADAPSSLG